MSTQPHPEHAVQTGIVLIPLNKLKKSPKNARKTRRVPSASMTMMISHRRARRLRERPWATIRRCSRTALTFEQLLAMLAILLAETLDFSHGGLLPLDNRLQRMSDALAAALDLDMTRHWEAGEEFWQAALKALAISALQAAPAIAAMNDDERTAMLAAFGKMKKAELARTAAQTLKDTGWLPQLLITPTRAGAFAVTPEGEHALATDACSATAA